MAVAFVAVQPLCPNCGSGAAPREPRPPLGIWFDVTCGRCDHGYRARWEVPLEPEAEKPRDAKRKG